ncbi:Ig-like domain-containing protein [Spirosoma aerolatum]|uniref:Ig-like domain-containing protein n=1 Tax=Spirosoma aerolatum TaxID=1211326 RepID=UPI0009AD5E07|nr:T9SS type A sorting domain-containing protein [Spirosoma aerolatum]
MKGRIFYSYLLALLGLAGLVNRVSAQTITSVALSNPSVCPGLDLTVTFVTSNTFATGNTFTISLSDVTGNAYPTSLTTISSRTGTSVKVTIPASSPTSTNYKIRVLSSTGTPVQSKESSAFTVNSANKPTVSSTQNGCAGTPTPLTATLTTGGVSLAWYNQSKQAISAPSPTASGTYYVSQLNGNTCTSDLVQVDYVANPVPAAPTATPSLSYCQGISAPALTASGSNLKWYGTASTGGSSTNTATIPSTSNPGPITYYVSQTVNGCESARTAITVTTKSSPDAPATTIPSQYCQNQTASKLEATASTGASLNWYGTNASGGTASSVAPIPGTGSAGTTNYYVSQTLNGCESSRASISVTTKPTPGAPSVSSPLLACQNRTGYSLSASASAGGSLNWYGTSASGGTATSDAPALATSTTGSTTYYVSQSVNNCEGPRASITFTVNAVPAAPTIFPPGAYCEGTTAAALSATGTSLKWYGTNASGGTSSSNPTVPSTDASAIGTKTYYVTQTVNSCESERIGIPVQVKDTPDAPGTSNIDFCQGTNAPTLTATLVNTATPNWYGTSSNGGTASPNAPTLSNSSPGITVYYVSQTLNGCEGPRASLSVRVKSTPGAPGVNSVSYCNKSQAQPLSAAGSNLKWYDASDNSLGGNAPKPGTDVVGTQTYKVSQTSNENCEGPKATITVTIKPLPGAPSVSDITYCQAQQDQPAQNVQDLSSRASGQNLRWYNPDGNQYSSAPTPSIDKGGTQNYDVSQTVDGCESSRARINVLIVSPPPPTAKALVSYCLNDQPAPLEATGEAGSKLKWVDPYGRVFDVAVPFTFTPSTDPKGDAFYVYQIASYGCYSARTTVRVLVSAPPTLALTAPTTTVNLGQRAPLNLKFTSVGPFSYTLTGGYTGTSRSTDTTISVLPRGNTIYQIVTVSNTCGLGLPGNPSTAQINVRVPTVSTSSFASSTVCSGTPITVPFTTNGQFNSGNAFRLEVVSAADTSKKYAIPNTSTGSPITGTLPTNLPGGQYFVRVNADNPEIGITGSNSPTQLTVRSLASATLTGTQNIYEGSPANLTLTFGGDGPWTATYADSLKNYSLTTSTNPLLVEVRPTRNTTYQLTKVTNFCGSGPVSGTATITILPLLGVEDNPLDPLVKTYPVPTETRLTVELDLPLTQNPAILSLIDANGQPILQQTTRAKVNELNLSSQPNGLYFLRIQVGDRQTVRKVLKQ